MRKARGSGAYLHSQLRDGCPAAPAVTISNLATWLPGREGRSDKREASFKEVERGGINNVRRCNATTSNHLILQKG